jgi:hypothetical protein
MKLKIILFLVFMISLSAHAQVPVFVAPEFIQHFFLTNGSVCAGCQLFVYQAGTTTKTPTYIDSTGTTTNTNPVIMNSRGEPQAGAPNGSIGIWLAAGLYKVVLAPANDSDPPTNPIWTIDGVSSSLIQPTAPVSSVSPCVPGEFAQDTSFFYSCVAINTWKRVALNSF